MYGPCMAHVVLFSSRLSVLGILWGLFWGVFWGSLCGCERSASPPPPVCRSPAQKSSEAPGESPPAAPRSPTRVVIVGGGIAGLVAAYTLEGRGIAAQILEADSRWGGRVATAEYEGGVTAEYGTQELWGDNPLLGIARELGIPLDANAVKPYSSAVIDGKLYPYFLGSREAYLDTLMTRPEKKRFLVWLDEAKKLRELAEREGLKNPEVRNLQTLSFAAWVESAKLDRSAVELVRLLIECELASRWHSFSALFGLMEFGVFLGEGQLAYHVSGGNSRLIEGLVRAIRGDKILSAQVTRIERRQTEGGRIGVRVYYQHNRRIRMVEAERVVVAVPFWRLHQIEMIPPLSEMKRQAVANLSRGQYTVVHLLMPKEARKLWMIGGKLPLALLTDGPLGVVYGPLGAPPAAPYPEVFSLLVHGLDAAAFHMVPRETKLQEIYAHLDKLWPGLSKHTRLSQVYTYHPGAVPVWPPGRSPLDELSQALREPELGLYLAGDYLYNAHSDGAARSGVRAAARIVAELVVNR